MEEETQKLQKLSEDLDKFKGEEKDLVKVNNEKAEVMRKKKLDFNDKDHKLHEKMKKNDKIEKGLEATDNVIKEEHDKLLISNNEFKKICNEVEGYKKVENANIIYKNKLEADEKK